MKVLTIRAPHFDAGVVIDWRRDVNEIVIQAAPIVSYMRGWKEYMVRNYAIKKGWDVIEQPSDAS